MQSWNRPFQNLKLWKNSMFGTRVFAKLVLSAVLVLSLSCAGPRIKFECPFPCRNADAAAEELAGALDDAPFNYVWIGDVEHACGCVAKLDVR